MITPKVENALKRIAERWNWENLEDDWTILNGAYCRLSWVLDGAELDDEYRDILELIEALQPVIKTKI